MAGIFVTELMNLQRAGTIIATGLPVQADTVNIDIILNSGGLIPTDNFDLYCDSIAVIPQRADYLIGQTTGNTYNVFGRPAVYSDHWEARATLYLGTTP